MQVSAVVSAVRAAVGSSWQDAEWDGLQAGSLDAEVTGMAVAWSPSLEVLKKAADAGCNLLITKAPLYWWESEPRRGTDSALSRLSEGTTGATPFTAIEATPYAEPETVHTQCADGCGRSSGVAAEVAERLCAVNRRNADGG
jgi:hypothetical protein